MDVNYEVRKPIIGNLDVVGKFWRPRTSPTRGAE